MFDNIIRLAKIIQIYHDIGEKKMHLEKIASLILKKWSWECCNITYPVLPKDIYVNLLCH